MITIRVNKIKLGMLAGLVMLIFENAQAGTSYSNLSDVPGLIVSASFTQAATVPFEEALGFDSFAVTTGDGTVTANNPAVSISPLAGNVFSNTFSVSGNANQGTVESAHFGAFAVGFQNNSTHDYAISLSLGYQLTAAASGSEVADSTVSLDWYTNDFSDSGSYYKSSNGDFSGDAGPVALNFILSANSGKTVFADVAIMGNLFAAGIFNSSAAVNYSVASVTDLTAVPLPPAMWSFLAGLLGVMGLKKRVRQ